MMSKAKRFTEAASLNDLAIALAVKTQDAYMAPVYDKSWTACARLMLKRGYTARETEAVLRSKLMRWADDTEGRGAGNQCNSKAFERYLDTMEADWRTVGLPRLVRETFGE